MECFTNTLNQSIPNVVELHKKYETCHINSIILQDNCKKQAKELADITKEKNDLIKTLDETQKDQGTCKKKLDAFKKYLEFIGSIDERIKNMDTCNSYLKIYCDCVKDKDTGCANRYLKYLNCEGALPQDYHNKIKASYSRLLDDVIMVKKNLTNLLITGDFDLMQGIYEQKKNLPLDNCQFICCLDVDLDTQFNATYWKTFADGWQLFRKYFLA